MENLDVVVLRTLQGWRAAGRRALLATVVRTVAATAAKAGAKAVILPDGTISEGWIGGGCARAAVLKAARDAIADGKSRLVSIQPPDQLDGQGHTAGEEQGGVISRFGDGRARLARAVEHAVAAVGEAAAKRIEVRERRHDRPAAGTEAALFGRYEIQLADLRA